MSKRGISSGARKALSRNKSAATGDISCTASKLDAQVVATDLVYRPRAGPRASMSFKPRTRYPSR